MFWMVTIKGKLPMNTSKCLKILICNDDGIHAPGLRVLWEALFEAALGELVIIAPAVEKSGTGAAITWDRPLLIQEVNWHGKTPAWSIDGTPADCVKLGLNVILKEMPDLIISGINAGSNAGRNVLHSGTIGAAIESILHGIPSIAISCEDGDTPNYHVAKKYIKPLVEFVLKNPLTPGTLLNVNVPHAAHDFVKGCRLTRQGKGRWVANPKLHVETKNGPTYFLGGKPEEVEEIEDCDIALLRQGYLTAVPIHIHELTDRVELNAKREKFEEFMVAQK